MNLVGIKASKNRPLSLGAGRTPAYNTLGQVLTPRLDPQLLTTGYILAKIG